MAILNILEYPDPRLRTKAVPVTEVNDNIKRIIDDMFETLYAAPGVGLAASQVYIHQRIIVIDLSEDESRQLAFINPEITLLDGELDQMDEGCFLIPGFYEEVSRIQDCLVKALDEEDKSEPLVFINPEITLLDGALETMVEGCLSIPGFSAEVPRIEHFLVKALDRDGKPFEMECKGLLAVCIQHEIDHLEGILYVDHISPLKRNRIKDKLQKKHKLAARQGKK